MPKQLTRRLTALLGLAAVWLVLYSAPALAHAQLLQAEPGDGATLTRAPDQVQLRFNEPVGAEFSPLEVYDGQGTRVDQDDARVSPDDARVILVGLEELTEGPYTVRWRVTSIDGHVVDGEYEFTIEAARADEPPGVQAGEGGGQEARAAVRDEPDPAEQSTGWSWHIIHYVGLGLGFVVVAALLLLGRR